MAVLGNTSVIKLDSVGNVSGQGFVKTSSSDSYVLLGGGGHLLLSSLGTYGTQGVQGTRGTQGAAGTKGVIGTQGVAGTKGVIGTQGPAGTKGVIGTQGAAGTKGVIGTQGVAGTNGVQGAIGTQGPAGTRGAKGTTGNAGTTGAAGTQGVQGAAGTQGIAGTQGAQGAAGTKGVIGTQGPAGTRGAKGTTGNKGTTGAAGTRGAQGTQGVQGTQGLSGSSKNLTLKKISGTTGTNVTYNGSAAQDLSGGIHYAYRSFGITSGGNDLTGGSIGQMLVKTGSGNGAWAWGTGDTMGTLTIMCNTTCTFTITWTIAGSTTGSTTCAANGSCSVPQNKTLSIAIPTALTNAGYTGASPYTYSLSGSTGTVYINAPYIQVVSGIGSTNVPMPQGFTKVSVFIINGGNGGTAQHVANGERYVSAGNGGKTTSLQNLSVSPGTTIACTVGAGGTHGQRASDSIVKGGTSSITITGIGTISPGAQEENTPEHTEPDNINGFKGNDGIANPINSSDSSLYGAGGGCVRGCSGGGAQNQAPQTSGTIFRGAGGTTGGGDAGFYNSYGKILGGNGTFYGAGGGSGCCYYNSNYTSDVAAGGNGYQGAVILKFTN